VGAVTWGYLAQSLAGGIVGGLLVVIGTGLWLNHLDKREREP
jgi:uncharacterized protein involved in exopolysaccharide biosynthesis